MKLYLGPLSLFSRKVELALREKGLSFDQVTVPFNQTAGYNPKHPDVVAANPKGEVPVLIDEDLVLFDSTLILEYLEDAYPDPPLYPESPVDRARCRLLDLFADEIMLIPLRDLMHRTEPRPEDPEKWEVAEARARQAEAVITDHLAELDDRLRDRSYLCTAFSAADISVFMATLFSQRLGGPSLERYRALSAWYQRLTARPAFREVTRGIRTADRELSAPVDGSHTH